MLSRTHTDSLLLPCFSYRPSIALTFIADELAFEDLTEADQFLAKNGAAVYIDPTPAELAAMVPPPTQANGKKKKSSSKTIPRPPLDKRQWDAKAAMQPLTDAIQKFRKVDVSPHTPKSAEIDTVADTLRDFLSTQIKGQI